MRVAFPFDGTVIGGSYITTIQFITELQSPDVEPWIVVHRPGSLTEYLDDRQISYHFATVARVPEMEMARWHRGMRLVANTFALAWYLRRNRIDIVHTNDLAMHVQWGGAARLAAIPQVWHQQSRFAYSRLRWYLLRSSAQVLTISKYCRASLPNALTSKASTPIIPNFFDSAIAAVDVGASRRALRDHFSWPDSMPVVAFVGNLTEQKRPGIFVETAARVVATYGRDIRFVLFGEWRSPLAEELEQRIRALGLEDICISNGPAFPIQEWLAGCDLLLAPAVEEGLGRTLIEAMLVGIPVIAADSGGHIEIVDHGRTGLLVEPDNPEAFAASTMKILMNRSWGEAMATTARSEARVNYLASDRAREMIEIYNKL